MWCWFTNFLTLLCTSLSKEPSQWNEILIKGIRMVYCWTFRTLSAFPSDAGQRTQSYLKIRCLDTNVICQSKIISAQDQLNTRILLNCPFDELFSFFSRSLFIHLSFFFFFFPAKCCLGVLCNYLVFQRQVVFENSAVDHCAGCRIAYYSLLPEARQSLGMQEQAHRFDISAATETILLCLTSEWIFRAKWASGWLLIDFYSPFFLTIGPGMKFIDCEGVNCC